MSPADGAAVHRLPATPNKPPRESETPWPEPDVRLLKEDRPPAPPLEDDALPAGWSDWLTEEAAARGCPRDYVAASLITAASALIGNARHVRATSTWSEPPHLWFALIGPPSAGKSPALRPVLEAVRSIEHEAEHPWRAEHERQAAHAEIARAIDQNWKSDVRNALKKGEPPPSRPQGAHAPPPPPLPRLLAMDLTTEELQRMLSEQPRGLLYIRDELAGWLGNHDRYGGHGGDRAFYLEAWNGAPYVVDRVKYHGQPLRIPRNSLAVLGGMQPDKLREALDGPEDGLGVRFAYVWPDPTPILPLSRERDNTAPSRRDFLRSAARRLFELGAMTDASEDAAPPSLLLDPEAFRLFNDLRREAMLQARSSRGLAAGWHGKTPGRALRLALVYELLGFAAADRPAPNTISGDSVARAGGYLDYLEAMLDRVTAGLAIVKSEADAAVIVRHLVETRAASFNERELYQQRNWSWLRENDRRAKALRVLCDAGIIRPFAGAGRGRRRGDWQVSPRLRNAFQ